MVGALEAVADGHITRAQIDEASRDEEGRDTTRALFLQEDRCFVDAAKAPNAGADQHAGGALVLVAFGMPAGVVESLGRGGDREDDVVIDLALLLGLHPLIGIEGALGSIAAGNHAGDLAGNVGNIESFNTSRAAASFEQALPGVLYATGERRNHPETGDDDPSHAFS